MSLMVFTKNLLKTISISALLLTSSAYAEKPNFSYSSLGLSVGSVNYKDPFCFSSQCDSSSSSASINGSLQLADTFVLSVQGGSEVLETYDWKDEASAGSVGIGVAIPVNDKMDFNAGVYSLSADLNLCIWGSCSKSTWDGTGFIAGLRSWLDNDRKFSGKIAYDSFKYSKSTDRTNTLILGVSTWIKEHHELSFKHESSQYSTSNSLGYTYVF